MTPELEKRWQELEFLDEQIDAARQRLERLEGMRFVLVQHIAEKQARAEAQELVGTLATKTEKGGK